MVGGVRDLLAARVRRRVGHDHGRARGRRRVVGGRRVCGAVRPGACRCAGGPARPPIARPFGVRGWSGAASWHSDPGRGVAAVWLPGREAVPGSGEVPVRAVHGPTARGPAVRAGSPGVAGGPGGEAGRAAGRAGGAAAAGCRVIQAFGVAFVLLVLVAKFGWWLVGGGLLVGWLFHSWRRPMTRCWWCNGSPRNYGSSGRSWSNCLVCGGSGRRRRVGAVLLGRGFGKM